MVTQRKKKGGGKLARTQVIQFRLDPELRYAAELGARAQRRTLSSFIEWAIEGAVRTTHTDYFNDASGTIIEVARKTWGPHEAERVLGLKTICPYLLTHDERLMFEVVDSCEGLRLTGRLHEFSDLNQKRMDLVKKHWEAIKQVATGDMELNDLPAVLREPVKSVKRTTEKAHGAKVQKTKKT